MSAKCLRRWVSCIAIVAVAFSQFAITAHACAVHGIASAPVAAHAGAPEGAGPCAINAAAPADAQGNACESHCSDGIVTGAQPDLPPAALIALPASAIALSELRAGEGRFVAALAPVSRAPPLTLQFCRLLI